MNRTQTIAAIKAIPGMTARYDRDAGEYRITITGIPAARQEAIASYTPYADDALSEAITMSAHVNEERAACIVVDREALLLNADMAGGFASMATDDRTRAAFLDARRGWLDAAMKLAPVAADILAMSDDSILAELEA